MLELKWRKISLPWVGDYFKTRIFFFLISVHFGPSVLRAPAEQTKVATVFITFFMEYNRPDPEYNRPDPKT